MERYAEMKGRIWDWQRPDNLAIANAADAWTMRETAGIASQLMTFDSRRGATTARGAVLEGKEPCCACRPRSAIRRAIS